MESISYNNNALEELLLMLIDTIFAEYKSNFSCRESNLFIASFNAFPRRLLPLPIPFIFINFVELSVTIFLLTG